MTESTNEAFLRLQEDLNWFVMCSEIRVLHIATSASERATVLHQVAMLEAHADNRSPFFILEDAHTRQDAGWIRRAERMRVVHDARREAMVQEGYPPSPLLPLQHGDNELGVMGWQLVQCLEAQRGVHELDGLVAVLAPTVLEQPDAFAESVRALLRIPELTPVRFVVIELGNAAAEHLLAGLGETGMHVQCIVDPAQHRREHLETMAAIAAAPSGASREVSAGHAGPNDVAAPPRAGQRPRDVAPPPEIARQLDQELGPTAALLGASGATLKRRITGAAVAMQERRFGDAFRLQSEACEQCWQAGLLRFGCILEVSLAGYFLHAGDAVRAHGAFETAASRAEAGALHDVTAQALLGLAAVRVVRGDLHGGAECYTRAGEAAERGQMPQLAVEAYRTAGQIALRAGGHAGAIAVWQRALGLVARIDPEVAAASSAPIVARALAKQLHDKGSFAAAQSLLVQADEYERAAAAPVSRGPAKASTSPDVQVVHAR